MGYVMDVKKNAKAPQTSRTRKRLPRLYTAMILIVAIAAVSGALVFLLMTMPSGEAQGKQTAVFGVKTVEVVGDTRYSREAIASASGIYVGQSIFSVNKRQAHENIAEAFPYIEYIEISNTAFDTIRIEVKETDVLGAMYYDGQWLVVGTNGRAVQTLPVENDRPPRYLYFRGATPAEGIGLGKIAMEERSRTIVETICDALDEYPLGGVTEIDLTDKADIQLNLNNQIQVKLGNDSNLRHEIAFVASALGGIYEQYGNGVCGVIDVSSYSLDGATDKLVFTPAQTLQKQTAATATAA